MPVEIDTAVDPFDEVDVAADKFSELPFRETLAIAEVAGCPEPTRWLRDFFATNTPVIFRGCALTMQALHDWTDDHLTEVAGDWVGGKTFEIHNLTFGRFLAAAAQDHRAARIPLPYSSRCNLPLPLRREISAPPALRCSALLGDLGGVHMRVTNGAPVKNGLHLDLGDFMMVQADGLLTAYCLLLIRVQLTTHC